MNQVRTKSVKEMIEFIRTQNRHGCQGSLAELNFDDVSVEAEFHFTPCGKNCPLSFLFGEDIIVNWPKA